MKRTLWLLVICGMLTAPAAAAPGDDVSSGTNAFLNGDFDK